MAPQLPPGLKIHYSDPLSHSRGRSLVATTSFPAGSVITTFKNPLLALPDGPSMRKTCNYCLRVESGRVESDTRWFTDTNGPKEETNKPKSEDTVKLRACTGCRAAVYCNADCQRAHWKEVHGGKGGECKMFGRVQQRAGKDWLPTPVRALAQVLIRLKAGDQAVAETFGSLAWAKGASDGERGILDGNVEGFKKHDQVWKDFEIQATGAVVYAGLENDFSIPRAREILCKIQTNAFNRLDPDAGMTGIYLDPVLAMANHSCMPSAFVSFDQRNAVLRAWRDIKEGDEITICYVDVTLPNKAARQEALKLYHFECRCPRCKDDLDVYQACQIDPALPLNSLSIQPDLEKLRNPPIDRSKVSKEQLDAIYEAWKTLPTTEGRSEAEHMKIARKRWEICKPLVEARMWAIEPLTTTIMQLAVCWQLSFKMVVYALPLLCFVSTECDPFKVVTPFLPWRIKGIVTIVQMLALTAELTASGALARRCDHEGLVGTLATADQVTMCEGLLRLVMKQGGDSNTGGWHVLKQAKAMLEDIEKLPGRETETAMLRVWEKDPEDPEASAFFHDQVIKPITTLASLAPEILEDKLGSKK